MIVFAPTKRTSKTVTKNNNCRFCTYKTNIQNGYENIKTPLLGINFVKNTAKKLLVGRNGKKFLKMFAQLITFKIRKEKKNIFKILPKHFRFFIPFSWIQQIEISSFPGSFFSTTKIRFCREF